MRHARRRGACDAPRRAPPTTPRGRRLGQPPLTARTLWFLGLDLNPELEPLDLPRRQRRRRNRCVQDPLPLHRNREPLQIRLGLLDDIEQILGLADAVRVESQEALESGQLFGKLLAFPLTLAEELLLQHRGRVVLHRACARCLGAVSFRQSLDQGSLSRGLTAVTEAKRG